MQTMVTLRSSRFAADHGEDRGWCVPMPGAPVRVGLRRGCQDGDDEFLV